MICKMFMWAWAGLTGGKLVWLRDSDGECTLSIARTDPFGVMYAERWWPFRVRRVRLLPEGVVDGGYVVEWKYA